MAGIETLNKVFEMKKQYVVDCTWCLNAFDDKEEADQFADEAIEMDYHDEKDPTPIQRRESYVIWKDGELVTELINVEKEEAEQILHQMEQKEIEENTPSSLSVNTQQAILELRHQYIVECSNAIFGFDEKKWADKFAEQAVEQGYHQTEEGIPIQTRRSYVIWKNGEFEMELETAETQKQAMDGLKQYIANLEYNA